MDSLFDQFYAIETQMKLDGIHQRRMSIQSNRIPSTHYHRQFQLERIAQQIHLERVAKDASWRYYPTDYIGHNDFRTAACTEQFVRTNCYGIPYETMTIAKWQEHVRGCFKYHPKDRIDACQFKATVTNPYRWFTAGHPEWRYYEYDATQGIIVADLESITEDLVVIGRSMEYPPWDCTPWGYHFTIHPGQHNWEEALWWQERPDRLIMMHAIRATFIESGLLP